MSVVTKLGKAPFPGKPAKQHKDYEPLDLEKVVKCRDPYKPERVFTQHKYNELFANLKEGDCFRLPAGFALHELSALARALRTHMQRNNLEGVVRQAARNQDGIGRVWLLKLYNTTTKEAA